MNNLLTFLPLIVWLAALLALDVLLLRLRKELQNRQSPLRKRLDDEYHRLVRRVENWQELSRQLWKKFTRARALAAVQPASPAPAQTKPAPSAVTLTDSEIPAAGSMARVQISAQIPPGATLHITIRADEQGRASVTQTQTGGPRRLALPRLPSLRAPLRRLMSLPPTQLAGRLFALALLLYLFTRLFRLTDFPIYFFGDEAVQTVSAFDLLQRGLRGPDGTFLPTYFQNGNYFNLSASVYTQLLPTLLFGKSIWVTRGVSVLVTLLSAVFIGLIARDFLNVKRWWLAALLLSVVPAWFIHSRTAFETALFVSFYTAFLYFYLDYRLRDPGKVYWAALWAGLAFYAYSPGQLVIGVTGVLLLLSDLRYHWQQRVTLLKAALLVAVIALPYIRFRLAMDYSPTDHLRELGSYWVQPLPLAQKITLYLGTYLYGLSPLYWFVTPLTLPFYQGLAAFVNQHWFSLTQFSWFETLGEDISRHEMLGYGNLPLWFLPLALGGLTVVLIKFRSSAHRAILLAALAAPAGAALAEIGITRVLVFVIPASLLAALGLDWVLEKLEALLDHLWRWRPSGAALSNGLTLAVFLPLAGVSIYMLYDALTNGPTWYSDYGLYGMQYGAKQVYAQKVVPMLESDSQAEFVITPAWANGADELLWFFVPLQYQPRVMLGQVYDLLSRTEPLTNETYFVVTPDEYKKIVTDPKFKQVTVRDTIPYPNRQTGFYFLNIQLADNIDQILAEEDAARRTPVEETIQWYGQTVRVVHSQLGGGTLNDLIDGDKNTLAKGEEANPIVYEFFFEKPIPTNQLELTTGSMDSFDVVVKLYAPGASDPVTYQETFNNLADDPSVEIPFTNGPAQAGRIFLSVRNNNQPEGTQVHIWEINFK